MKNMKNTMVAIPYLIWLMVEHITRRMMELMGYGGVIDIIFGLLNQIQKKDNVEVTFYPEKLTNVFIILVIVGNILISLVLMTLIHGSKQVKDFWYPA